MSRFSWRRLAELHRASALILLNILLFLIGLNLVLGLIFRVEDALTADPGDPVTRKYAGAEFARVYPGRAPEEIRAILTESFNRPFVYQPFTQFTERPFAGRHVTVDPAGFRRIPDQGPWPPAATGVNIFLFGGSTTFGYGVPDDDTIAAHLQRQLREGGLLAAVYNFGRGHYYSTQERILFQQLLVQGFQPTVALFIDGLNDFYHDQDMPKLTNQLSDCVDHLRRPTSREWALFSNLPMARANRAFNDWFKGVKRRWRGQDRTGPLDAERFDRPEVIDQVLERHRRNRELIAAMARVRGVQAAFVWQPVPTFAYDLQQHLFIGDDFGRHALSHYGYTELAQRLAQDPPGPDILWCAEIQRDLAEPLYVDQVHYSGAMSARVARCIAERLAANGLIPAMTDGHRDAPATGLPEQRS
ncbi:MAG: SGNH/GDSL hydrolase family protein [Magnetococcales bacterium]|nr:SGNH/GDSL hydrolase family protein [Magnetococcales bacterium]